MKGIIGLVLIASLSACATRPQLPVFSVSDPAATDDVRLHAVLDVASRLDSQYQDGYNHSARSQDLSQLPIIALAAGAALLVLLKAKYVGDLIGGLGIGAAAYTAGRDQIMAKDLPRYYLAGHAALGCVTDEAPLFDGPSAAARQRNFKIQMLSFGGTIANLRGLARQEAPAGSDASATQNLAAAKAVATSALADADVAYAAGDTALQAFDNRVGAFRHAVDAIGTAVATRARTRPAVDFAALQASFYTPPTMAAATGLSNIPLARQLADQTAGLIAQTAQIKALTRGTDYAAALARIAKCPDLVG